MRPAASKPNFRLAIAVKRFLPLTVRPVIRQTVSAWQDNIHHLLVQNLRPAVRAGRR